MTIYVTVSKLALTLIALSKVIGINSTFINSKNFSDYKSQLKLSVFYKILYHLKSIDQVWSESKSLL